jgi:hypothetical protein
MPRCGTALSYSFICQATTKAYRSSFYEKASRTNRHILGDLAIRNAQVFGDDSRAAAKPDADQVSSKREEHQEESAQIDLLRQDEADVSNS